MYEKYELFKTEWNLTILFKNHHHENTEFGNFYSTPLEASTAVMKLQLDSIPTLTCTYTHRCQMIKALTSSLDILIDSSWTTV